MCFLVLSLGYIVYDAGTRLAVFFVIVANWRLLTWFRFWYQHEACDYFQERTGTNGTMRNHHFFLKLCYLTTRYDLMNVAIWLIEAPFKQEGEFSFLP